MSEIDPIYARIGERIASLRRDRGWTQEGLAERVERNASFLARIESGKRRASLDTLILIAEALEVPLSALVAEESDPDELPPELIAAARGLDREGLLLLARVAQRMAGGGKGKK